MWGSVTQGTKKILFQFLFGNILANDSDPSWMMCYLLNQWLFCASPWGQQGVGHCDWHVMLRERSRFPRKAGYHFGHRVAEAKAWCGGGHGHHTTDETNLVECAMPHVDQELSSTLKVDLGTKFTKSQTVSSLWLLRVWHLKCVTVY